MIKKVFQKIVLTSLVIAAPLMAEFNFDKDTYSLLAFEGGYSTFDVEFIDNINPSHIEKYNMMHAGLKIGAQSKSYRFFLSARYFNADDFDYATTIGAEIQYMFNFSRAANFYLGLNGGVISMRFAPAGEVVSRTISDPYYGADVGFNIHLSRDIDFDFGARIMQIEAFNSQVVAEDRTTEYYFDSLVSAYVSVVFKYKMD